MFGCDGKCIEKTEDGFERRCKQYYTITLYNLVNKKDEVIEGCFTEHLLQIGFRIESALVRIQAAVEDSRNEEAINEVRTGNIIATGFTAMAHAVNNDPKRFENALNLINETFRKGEQKIIDIQKHRSDKLKELE